MFVCVVNRVTDIVNDLTDDLRTMKGLYLSLNFNRLSGIYESFPNDLLNALFNIIRLISLLRHKGAYAFHLQTYNRGG